MSEFEWAEGKGGGGGGRETSDTKAIVVAVAPLLLIPPPPHPVVLPLPLHPGAILFLLLPFLAPPDTTADPGGGDASSFQISPPPSDRSPLSRGGGKNPLATHVHPVYYGTLAKGKKFDVKDVVTFLAFGSSTVRSYTDESY